MFRGFKIKYSGRKRVLSETEHDIQAACVQWSRYNYGKYPMLKFLHSVPNGANLQKVESLNKKGKKSRYCPNYTRLASEGLNPGVPDLCLPYPMGIYHGLYIEMKSKKGKISEEQEEWIKYLKENNYRVEVCRSLEEFMAVVKEYLKGYRMLFNHNLKSI